jgi:enoyl-CoA hydratase
MSDIAVETARAVCRIYLNRPDCGNLVTMGMVRDLTTAMRDIPADVKLVVIAGRGNDFCKGRDYQTAPESAAAGQAAPTALKIRDTMTAPMMTLYQTLRELRVATLSIVQGAAFGFGCALAGACDMTIAGESARFRLPEMTRGLPPTLAMSALWERIPPRTIGYMVYSTAELHSRTALSIGLANAVIEDAALASHADAVIENISKQSLEAVKAVKDYLREAPSMSSAGRGAYAESLFAGVLSSV